MDSGHALSLLHLALHNVALIWAMKGLIDHYKGFGARRSVLIQKQEHGAPAVGLQLRNSCEPWFSFLATAIYVPSHRVPRKTKAHSPNHYENATICELRVPPSGPLVQGSRHGGSWGYSRLQEVGVWI